MRQSIRETIRPAVRHHFGRYIAGASMAVLLAAACSQPAEAPIAALKGDETPPPRQMPAPNPLKNAYFGDLHMHTRNSFDAYIFNVRATPNDAYKYAKGGTIKHAAGFDVKLNSGPLDFLAVTDHSEYLGVLPNINTPGTEFSKVPYAKDLFSKDLNVVNAAFRKFGDSLREGKRMPEFTDMGPTKSAWQEEIDAAKSNYEPGKFTTLVAYEFTSAPDGRNLHRNVIFGDYNVPGMPFSALESRNPEDLWRWLDDRRKEGMKALVIPHNSNGSDGTMFERTKWSGEPIDREYAELRARNEKLVEVTQVKGTSETHPLLSPTDELAGFEIMEWYIGSSDKITKFAGGYVRDALRTGLEMQTKQGFNPYKMGFIGSSDSHNAAGAYEENNYFSKVGIMDASAELRGSVPPPEYKSWADYTPALGVQRYSSWGASGLAGVWAEENTREAIYAALERKETFATSGPRIRVRLFAGYGLEGVKLADDAGVKAAYAKGVPMGGDLTAKAGKKPIFLTAAMRDPMSAPLQRIQIVKGWTDSTGKSFERIYDVACADGGKIDPKTDRCSDNGATVDLKTCAFSQDKGDGELNAAWSDPEFDPAQNAFYYARVIENPTCRWSTWDAIRAGVEPSPNLEKTIQERAYSSPIWIIPTHAN
jgi:hypothetical protein